MPVDKRERKEQRARAQAWYAILGFGALAGGAFVILRWMPDNPFNTPSELPNTTALNTTRLTGTQAPMLPVRPSEMGSIGAGCRVSDVALVQNVRGALRQTTVESVEVFLSRQRGRGRRVEPAGWSAHPPDGDGGTDGGAPAGCVVELSLRDARGERRAAWTVSQDRDEVLPANALAREISALAPGLRAR